MRQRQLAEHRRQLSFDFQPPRETAPAKVIALTVRARRDAAGRRDAGASRRRIRGRRRRPASRIRSGWRAPAACFAEGAALDTGDADRARRPRWPPIGRPLALDPTMTAALVNLANIHYARDRAVEAEALYEKALAIEPTSFEAHFNLGNVCHDTGRFEAAARCYARALALDPAYADAHFYLAVTLEKLGRSAEARPHWVAYQTAGAERRVGGAGAGVQRVGSSGDRRRRLAGRRG